jgi:rhamnulokinase
MSNFFVACDLKAECGRVVLGILNQGALTLSEVRRFENLPIRDKDSLHWNIPQLYEETLTGLRAVGAYEEAVDGISCDSWAAVRKAGDGGDSRGPDLDAAGDVTRTFPIPRPS